MQKNRNIHIQRWLKRVMVGFALLLSAVGLSAQENGLVNISFDPEADSVYFAKVRSYLNEIRKERPTVALVLAGGGAKGAAHIGVLKYLEEKGMPIDFVAGTSMGALMGGLYCMGYSAEEIDSIVRSIDWNMMMSDNIPMEFYSYKRKSYKNTYVLDVPFTGTEFLRSLPSGFVYGLNIYNMLSALSVGYQEEGMDFMNMPTPYCCVATEIVSQKEKHWTTGPLIDAMRSTMSIPGYFMPVQIDSLLFSDGGTKNNFPTDIAKAVGADIIIGVEMTLPRDYAKVNNIAEVLMQTLQYSGGLEAHNQNVKNATVYITPDISGFGMLSFGTEEVVTLISRGYHEAIKHTREIDSIIKIVGNGGRELHNKPSINTALTKVKVTSVSYEGVDNQEMQYLDDKIRMKVDECYGREDFELAQSIIFGTMVFTHVTYRLENDGHDGYKLVFHCVKRPENSIGIGLRADSEEWLGMILNGGFGTNKLFGSTFDVTLRLSLSPYLKVDWSYMPKRGPKFGAYLKTQYRTQLGTVGNEFNYSYYKQSWQNEVRAYIAGTTWSQVDLSGGVRVEAMPFYKQIGETPDPVYRKQWDWKDIHPYAYVRFVYDNEDARYFPERGVRLKVAYDYNFKKTHYVAAGVHGVIPICRFFSILASLNGRYILGGDYLENMNMRNYVGGAMAGRYYEHQIPFVGINGERSCDRLVSTVDLDLRFKIAKKYYVSLIAAAMHDGNSIESYKEKFAIFGAALQFGYKSKFGPLTANVHWNSFDKTKVGVYLSAGYDF